MIWNVYCIVDYNDNSTEFCEFIDESLCSADINIEDKVNNIMTDEYINDALQYTMNHIYKKAKIKYRFMLPRRRLLIFTFFIDSEYWIKYIYNIDTKTGEYSKYLGNSFSENYKATN